MEVVRYALHLEDRVSGLAPSLASGSVSLSQSCAVLDSLRRKKTVLNHLSAPALVPVQPCQRRHTVLWAPGDVEPVGAQILK